LLRRSPGGAASKGQWELFIVSKNHQVRRRPLFAAAATRIDGVSNAWLGSAYSHGCACASRREHQVAAGSALRVPSCGHRGIKGFFRSLFECWSFQAGKPEAIEGADQSGFVPCHLGSFNAALGTLGATSPESLGDGCDSVYLLLCCSPVKCPALARAAYYEVIQYERVSQYMVLLTKYKGGRLGIA